MVVQLAVIVVTDTGRAFHALDQLGNRTFIAQTAISSSRMPTVLMHIGGKLIHRHQDLNMTAVRNDNTVLFVMKKNAAATVWP
jgi:hypothetical protein